MRGARIVREIDQYQIWSQRHLTEHTPYVVTRKDRHDRYVVVEILYSDMDAWLWKPEKNQSEK